MKPTLLLAFFLCALQAWGQFETPNRITPGTPPARDSIFGLQAASRSEIATGQANWTAISEGGAAEDFDDFVGLLSDGVGTNPVLFIFDNFENYTIDTVWNDDTGVYIIQVGGYDYGLQDDFTWVDATPGIGVARFIYQFGPVDNFGEDDDLFMLNIYDENGTQGEMEGYYYIEIRIYPD